MEGLLSTGPTLSSLDENYDEFYDERKTSTSGGTLRIRVMIVVIPAQERRGGGLDLSWASAIMRETMDFDTSLAY